MRARHAPTPVGEVIALVVFVGYSVTYALHIAHNYNQAGSSFQLGAEEAATLELRRNVARKSL